MPVIVLQTEQLTKRFGALTAVDNLSLEVQEGEIFGFLGPNGAGKTTSISLMCGLLKPDQGRVLIHGQLMRGGTVDVRSRVGVCPQETVLWDKLTALEQLEFIGCLYGAKAKAARERGSELLETLGLASKAKTLGSKLSGGMKRRLNLALALIHDPEILVLDEPEAGLDPQSRVLVREYIRSLRCQKTIILTTHNMDEADRLADRVAIIDHGRLLVVETPEALKRRLGEGDVLEVDLVPPETGVLPDGAAITALAAPHCAIVSLIDDMLALRGRGLIDVLPALLQSLHAAGIRTADVRLRGSTLEDVFLSLTGRRLRE